MGKIGIITLNGYFNYGNRLQNYALEQVLRSIGFKVETIIVDNKNLDVPINRKKFLDKIKGKKGKDLIFFSKNKIKKYLYNQNHLNLQREEIFKEFSLKYLSETDFTISEKNIPQDLLNRYDYFITGSDQVWNPNYTSGSSIYFLTFAPKNKRISYAASFGVSEIPEEYIDNYKKWLSEMPHLSVREEAGAKIVKDLTGREATVSLDPTMLLTKEQWLSISQVPSHKLIKGYLLTYFLGNIPKERENLLKDIAKRNDLEIVNLARVKEKIPYLTGPSEFIDYIDSASVFCTDSFHGAAFSILLETPFIVFERIDNSPSMNSRIETLLTKFKLESRLVQNIKSNEQIFEIDYSHVPPILQKERDSSINYLKNALNID